MTTKKRKPHPKKEPEKKDLIDERIEYHLRKKEIDTIDVFNRVHLFIYDLSDPESDIEHLARLLPDEYLTRVIDFFDDSVIHVPGKEKRREAKLLALIYFLYDIKHFSWDRIKQLIDFDVLFKDYSLLSLGKRIVKIRRAMSPELLRQLESVTTDASTTVKKVLSPRGLL